MASRVLAAISSLLIGVWSIGLPSPAHAAPSAMERSQEAAAMGDEALERGDHREAIARYREAYNQLTPTDRASYIGSIPVRSAMRAHAALLVAEDDPALVREQLELLTNFLDEVERQGTADQIGEDVLSDLRELQQTLRARLDADQNSSEPQADQSSPAPPLLLSERSPTSSPTDRPDRTAPPRRDWVGLGMIIGGAVVAGTGAALAIGRWTIPTQARRYADETPGFESQEGSVEGTLPRTQYLADEQERAERFLLAGGVTLGVGLAVVVAGGIELGVRRRRASAARVALVPAAGRTGAALSLRAQIGPRRAHR